MFCNVSICNLGIKLGFRLGKSPLCTLLRGNFPRAKNSICIGQAVYLTCETGVINISLLLEHALFTFFSFSYNGSKFTIVMATIIQ